MPRENVMMSDSKRAQLLMTFEQIRQHIEQGGESACWLARSVVSNCRRVIEIHTRSDGKPTFHGQHGGNRVIPTGEDCAHRVTRKSNKVSHQRATPRQGW